MDKVIVEQDLLRILFPPKGDVPLEKLDSIKTIRYYLGLAIDLAGGQEKKRAIISRADNDALNREIVKQRQAGVRWKDIAKNTGMSDAAVRKRYRRAVEGSSPPGGPADAQAEPQEPATQAPAEFSPIKANVQHVGDGLPDVQPPSSVPSPPAVEVDAKEICERIEGSWIETDFPSPPESEPTGAIVQLLSASSPGEPADAQAGPKEPATQVPEGSAKELFIDPDVRASCPNALPVKLPHRCPRCGTETAPIYLSGDTEDDPTEYTCNGCGYSGRHKPAPGKPGPEILLQNLEIIPKGGSVVEMGDARFLTEQIRVAAAPEAPVQPLSASSPGEPADAQAGPQEPATQAPAEFSPIKANVQHVGDGLPDVQPPSTVPSATDTPEQHPPTIRELEAVEAPVQPLSASSPGGPADAQAEPKEPATQPPEGSAEPKIPHSYDERIQQLSREGCGRKFILKALRQEGITGIRMPDVDARMRELAKKKQSRKEIIQSLSPADQDILNLADKGALFSEICVLVSRKHHENLTTHQMVNRIADIRHKLRGAK